MPDHVPQIDELDALLDALVDPTGQDIYSTILPYDHDTVEAAIGHRVINGGGMSAGIATFSQAGTLTTGIGVSRFTMPAAGTITSVVAAVTTAPTGASIKCDVNKNGTTIFTTQGNCPTIAAGARATATQPTPDVTSFIAGDYFTVDIDQVGSGVAGADLVVNVVYTLS